jgi:hydroxyacylglutathione hydrolase
MTEYKKFPLDSNCYFLPKQGILIDTGRRENRRKLTLKPSEVRTIILTHLHYDHAGNIDMFPDAKVYASAEEIACFKRDPLGTVLNSEIAMMLKERGLHALKEVPGFEIIICPGHTRGSIALWDTKDKVLFSGDTLFYAGFGRIDLPTSEPEKMAETLEHLKRYEYRTLCPGHDY